MATRTLIQQDVQIRNTPSDVYNDDVAAGSAMQTAAATLSDDLNNVRSQLQRWLNGDTGGGNWYDDITTVNSKKRGLNSLNSSLNTVEIHRFLFRTNIHQDITHGIASVASSGTITTVPVANLLDGETVTLNDGGYLGAVVFEFDVTGDGVSGSNIPVDVSALTTADQVRDALISAITGVAGFEITASSGGAASVALVNNYEGYHGNVTSTTTVADGGFAVAGMISGTGANVIVIPADALPTETIALVSTTEGVVVSESAFSEAPFPLAWELLRVASTSGDPTHPKNLIIIKDALTGELVQSETRDVYGIFVVENGAVDGTAFDSGTQQVKLVLVRLNAGLDDLEPAPSSDIPAAINYQYSQRKEFLNVPEDAHLPLGMFIDHSASVDVTLDNAIDNQSGNATQNQNIVWDVADGFTLNFTSDNGGTPIISVAPTGGGDTLAINADTLDVNLTNDADFSQGAKFDTGGTEIDIGVTAGVIETTSVADLRLLAAGELLLDDSNQTGSTWAQTTGIKLSETTAEWDAFDTAFGEVSLLNALVLAKQSSSRSKVIGEVIPATIIQDINVTGAGGSPNLSAQLPDYSSVAFLTDVDVFHNGVLLYNGPNVGTPNDVYPGTTPANGDLKFSFRLRGAGAPDIITMMVHG